MRYTFHLLIFVILLLQCKTEDNLVAKTNISRSLLLMSSGTDTIYGYKDDTVIVSIPVEFTKGRLWSQLDTVTQISYFKQDETQQFDGNDFKDFQRFYYTCKDTGSFSLTYLLSSPIGKDTTIYSTQSKYFIIKQ